MIKSVLFAVAVSIACSAGATELTQSQMTKQACDAFADAQRSLGETVARVRAAYRNDAVFLAKFDAYEKAWEAFHQAYLDARWPAADKRVAYGSVWPMCNCLEEAATTKQHTEEIVKYWLTPAEEGDVCAGQRP